MELRTTRQVAEALGIEEWRIESVIRRRKIARPPVMAGVRLWSPRAVADLRAVIGRCDPPPTGGHAPSAPHGPGCEPDAEPGSIVALMDCTCGRQAPVVRQIDEDLVVVFVRCACGSPAPREGSTAS